MPSVELRTTWDLGNTTVRNPARLLEGLRLFADHISGHLWNKDEQARVWGLLKEAGLINSETEDEQASLGRKWYSALRQLGFVELAANDYVYVTEAGRALIEHPDITDMVFLRQLVKYKLESPLERTRLQGFNFRPFITFLRFLKLAHDNGLDGLTRDEIALFVVTTMTEDANEVARIFWEQVVSFREGYDQLTGKVAKSSFVKQQLLLHAPPKPKTSTLVDYADSSARYARISGLVTQSGLGFGGRFRLAEGRQDLVTQLLETLEPIIPDELYVQMLHNPEQPRLPIDDVAMVASEIEALEREIAALGETRAAGPSAQTMLAQHAQATALRQRRAELNEFRFYRQQRTWEALDEVRELLDQIRTKNLPASRSYAPAFLEWALWRLFLAINDIRIPIAQTRGFRVDDAFVPIHHAVGGAADCTFAYDRDALVIEATLTASSRQVVAENESVRRHVAKAVDAMSDKKVLGLFVALRVDANTYDEFHAGRFRLQEETLLRLSIIPLTIKDIIDLIDAMKAQEHMLTSSEMLSLLRQLDELRRSSDDGVSWRNAIRHAFPRIINDLPSLRV